jgi:DNA-binding NtrC family response regulator
VDVRIIAATHRDLEAAIQQQQFRQDLYYRLSVVTINIPPLNERAEDIPDMVKYFLKRYGKEVGVSSPSIQPDAITCLQSQLWPGNVRELENAVRQALLAAKDFTITENHVREVLTKSRQPVSPQEQTHAAYISDLLDRVERGEIQNAFTRMLSELEPELYAQVIRRAQGNLTKAAAWLGVTRLKMREKLKEFGLYAREESPEE